MARQFLATREVGRLERALEVEAGSPECEPLAGMLAVAKVLRRWAAEPVPPASNTAEARARLMAAVAQQAAEQTRAGRSKGVRGTTLAAAALAGAGMLVASAATSSDPVSLVRDSVAELPAVILGQGRASPGPTAVPPDLIFRGTDSGGSEVGGSVGEPAAGREPDRGPAGATSEEVRTGENEPARSWQGAAQEPVIEVPPAPARAPGAAVAVATPAPNDTAPRLTAPIADTRPSPALTGTPANDAGVMIAIGPVSSRPAVDAGTATVTGENVTGVAATPKPEVTATLTPTPTPEPVGGLITVDIAPANATDPVEDPTPAREEVVGEEEGGGTAGTPGSSTTTKSR